VKNSVFNEHDVLHDLKHYLPAQAPLKDFIHHNTLHAFQHVKFNDGLRLANEIFGYKTLLTLDEYRDLYKVGKIKLPVLRKTITRKKGVDAVDEWLKKVNYSSYENNHSPRLGQLRAFWKRDYRIDLDSLVHPFLFRILCSYLDQGISMWNFPVWHKGFLASIREIERNSMVSFFKTERARELLLTNKSLASLLKIVVGDEALYKQYIFDQQFAHQGWSGMIASIEDNPDTLLDKKKISIHDLIVFELLLEIDALDLHFKNEWTALGYTLTNRPKDLFAEIVENELHEVLTIWQEAYEWSYYDEVLYAFKSVQNGKSDTSKKSFQAMFCIDDRECSIRRHLEHVDADCETFGTPGFFGVEFFYKPEHGKFHTKLCPAPITPAYLVKEVGSRNAHKRDLHFTKNTHSLFRGWLIAQTLGFWSAFKLFVNIFKPSISPATATSFRHMDKFSKLTIECKDPQHKENNLQVGFTVVEMANRVEGLLRSIGLVKNFAPIVYVVGHGSSSINNPHYAAYDCGACSGRPGSVNARVFCHMANHDAVRLLLGERGIEIPVQTQFVGGLHDTTRDEIMFFDEEHLNPINKQAHENNEEVFAAALDLNAKERSRRFEIVDSSLSLKKIHYEIRKRSVSLFEPRPELNHATNALCVVGKRSLTKHLFLDRRSFLNSYDHSIDPDGKYLFNILKAAAPVCGGINLEYFFSRVDNQKLGAGTKLPHNVMGLFGVANGIDGDLRPGLPSQMIEVHDPIRLMILVEQTPEVVLNAIQRSPETYEWFINEWVHLVVIHPQTKAFWVFREAEFSPYKPIEVGIDALDDLQHILETHHENLPVYIMN
jgi:uncharacterized protein